MVISRPRVPTRRASSCVSTRRSINTCGSLNILVNLILGGGGSLCLKPAASLRLSKRPLSESRAINLWRTAPSGYKFDRGARDRRSRRIQSAGRIFHTGSLAGYQPPTILRTHAEVYQGGRDEHGTVLQPISNCVHGAAGNFATLGGKSLGRGTVEPSIPARVQWP
jgi:hypothetical protein